MPTTISGDTGVSAVQNGAVDLTTDVSGVLPVANGGNGTATANASFKNRIINGAMDIWQRGTSFSTPSSNSYSADRWTVFWAGTAPASIARITGNSGFKYALQVTGAASNTYTAIAQKIESVNCTDLASQSVAISANLQSSSAMTVQWQLQYANSIDNWSTTTAITSGTWNVTTSAQQFTATASSLPSGVANGLMLVIYPNNASSFTSGTLNITGVQLEKGSTATSFDYRPYGTELQLCQRYYYKFGLTAFSPLYIANTHTTTAGRGYFFLPVTMRTSPTSITIGGSGFGAGSGTYSNTTYDRATTNAVMVNLTGTGFLANGCSMIYGASDGTSFISVDVEL